MSAPSASQSRPDVLYLVHRFPYPPDKGDRIRAFHLLRFLSRHASVHVACLADEPVPPESLAALEQVVTRVAVVPVGKARWGRALASLALGGTATEGAFRSSALRAIVERWAAETPFRATLSSASSMAPYQCLPALRRVPAVVDLVDVDSQKWLDYALASGPPKSWLYALEGRRLRRLEQGLPAWARAVTVVTEAEADLYRGFTPDAPVHAVGNGVDLEYFHPPEEGNAPPEEPACVFVGAFDYRPNIDGAVWFCREVWPRVRQARPDAKVYLVGRRPAPAVVALGAIPGVEVAGQVPDVRPWVARSALSIAPLRIARGVQNKVLEALAMGKAVVGSPTTLAGLRGASTPGVLLAASPEEWADAILRLLGDRALRDDLGRAGRRYVVEHHDWATCLSPFLGLLNLRGVREPACSSCG